MAAAPFNTLKFAKRLEAAGFTPDQAGGTAEALADVMADSDIATNTVVLTVRSALKHDILAVRSELKNELHALRDDFKNDLYTVETKLENRMELLRRDLTIRTGGMFIVAVGVLLTGMRLML